MNLRQLEAFKATIQAGSISGAAELLNISQPSVSCLVSDLERSVRFPLFAKKGRGLVATPEARQFFKAVETMFIGIDSLKTTAEAIRYSAGGELSFGVIPSLVNSMMPIAVKKFQEVHSEVNVSVSVRNTPEIVEAVLMQQLDLGVVSGAFPLDGVEIIHQTSLDYVCLMPSCHALSRNSDVDLFELDLAEVVTLNAKITDDSLQVFLKQSAAKTSGLLTSHSVPAIAAMARETGRIAIVDPFTARLNIRLGDMTMRPFKQDLRYTVAIIARGTSTLSLASKQLAEIVIKQLQETTNPV